MIELSCDWEDGFNGHRIYGASVFLGKGEFYCFLDEDNWGDANHIDSLLQGIKRGFYFAFSFPKNRGHRRQLPLHR